LNCQRLFQKISSFLEFSADVFESPAEDLKLQQLFQMFSDFFE